MSGAPFRKIGIAGSGRMGESIFYHLNDFDHSLVWVFRNPDLRNKAIDKFNKKMKRMHKAGALDDRSYQFRTDHTIMTTNLEDLSNCDLLIETIVEDKELKAGLFNKLDGIVKRDCIFVSNSSSIKPSMICPDSDRKERFAGLHFFYPVQFNTIVELIGADTCSSQTIESLITFTREIRKQPIVLSEQGAFILNKAFIYVQAQAFRFYREKILSLKEIDALIKKHLFAMGLFEFLDHVGLDVILSSAKYYIEDMEHKDFIRVTVKETQQLVDQGYLGVKSGRGFYTYNKEQKVDEPSDFKQVSEQERNKYEEEVVNKLICLYINSAYDFVDKRHCTEAEIDAALNEYKGMEKGPITLCNQIGAARVYDLLMDYYRQTGERVFYPSPSLRKKAEQERSKTWKEEWS